MSLSQLKLHFLLWTPAALIFYHWWLGQWAACGGELEDGARQLVGPVLQQFFAPPN